MRFKYRRWLPLLLFSILLLGATSLAWAQEAKPALAILQVDDARYPQMKVLVSVADANGIPIQGLQKDAFLITEDGRAAPIQTVQEVPGAAEVNVALALDVSGSMKGQPIDATRQAAARLLQSLSAQDKAALLTFNQKVKELAPLGSDRNAMIAALQSIQADGDTALFDAIHQGVMVVKDAPSGRRAVVIFSDGEDTKSTLTLEDAVKSAQRFAVPVYIVGYGPKIKPQELQRIAQLTGGAFFRAPKLEDIPTAFAQVLDALHRAYEIVYLGETPADNKEHELRVILSHSGQSTEESVRFIARAGNIDVNLALEGLPDRVAAEAVWNALGEAPVDAGTPLVGGQITINPQTQPGRAQSADILLDGNIIATDVPLPYVWDASAIDPGPHNLSVKVTDHVGNEKQVDQPIVVIPVVYARMTSPSTDQPLTGVAPIAIDIATIHPISEVVVTFQKQELARFSGPPYEFNWDTTQINPGDYTMNVSVTTQNGDQTTFSFPITVGEHIQIAFVSPSQDEELKGKVLLQADVTSDVRVKDVTFLINDQEIARVDNPPYKTYIHTGDFPPGAYELKAEAENVAGMKADDAIQVTMIPVTRTGALGIALILALGLLLIVPIIFFARKRRQQPEPPTPAIPPGEEPPPTTVAGASSSAARQPMGWLTLVAGKADQPQYPIYQGETKIGRNREFADIWLADLGVSRRHAIITASPEGVFYEDLNEQNPTRINGRPIRGRVQLQNGDRIQLGNTEFLFQA